MSTGIDYVTGLPLVGISAGWDDTPIQGPSPETMPPGGQGADPGGQIQNKRDPETFRNFLCSACGYQTIFNR